MAANIAEQLLLGLEPYAESGEELEARKLLLSGEYHYVAEQRRLRLSTGILAQKEYHRVLELISGVKV